MQQIWKREHGNLGEYYPYEYANDKEYYANKHGIDIIEGNGVITIINNSLEDFEFRISESKNLKVELPRIYYKGYKLTKNEEMVEVDCNKYGLITVDLKDRRI